MPKRQKFKCDILSNFQTMCGTLKVWKISNWLSNRLWHDFVNSWSEHLIHFQFFLSAETSSWMFTANPSSHIKKANNKGFLFPIPLLLQTSEVNSLLYFKRVSNKGDVCWPIYAPFIRNFTVQPFLLSDVYFGRDCARLYCHSATR